MSLYSGVLNVLKVRLQRMHSYHTLRSHLIINFLNGVRYTINITSIRLRVVTTKGIGIQR